MPFQFDAHHRKVLFYLENNKPISEKKCIEIAKSNKLELEFCTSDLGNVFLRTPQKACFKNHYTR